MPNWWIKKNLEYKGGKITHHLSTGHHNILYFLITHSVLPEDSCLNHKYADLHIFKGQEIKKRIFKRTMSNFLRLYSIQLPRIAQKKLVFRHSKVCI